MSLKQWVDTQLKDNEDLTPERKRQALKLFVKNLKQNDQREVDTRAALQAIFSEKEMTELAFDDGYNPFVSILTRPLVLEVLQNKDSAYSIEARAHLWARIKKPTVFDWVLSFFTVTLFSLIYPLERKKTLDYFENKEAKKPLADKAPPPPPPPPPQQQQQQQQQQPGDDHDDDNGPLPTMVSRLSDEEEDARKRQALIDAMVSANPNPNPNPPPPPITDALPSSSTSLTSSMLTSSTARSLVTGRNGKGAEPGLFDGLSTWFKKTF